jgi:hypothetical protein
MIDGWQNATGFDLTTGLIWASEEYLNALPEGRWVRLGDRTGVRSPRTRIRIEPTRTVNETIEQDLLRLAMPSLAVAIVSAAAPPRLYVLADAPPEGSDAVIFVQAHRPAHMSADQMALASELQRLLARVYQS